MTDVLLLVGIATAVVFLVVMFFEGALRPRYSPAYHTASELTLGNRGWIQIANFIQMGVGMFAFALGVFEVLGNTVAAALLGVFGLGSIISGTFRPDALRGYPPDANEQVTWRGQLHNASGPLMFVALFAACLTLAGSFQSPWQIYTMVTAALGLVLTVATAASFQRDAAHTGTVQRALLLVYWAWIISTGVHLTTSFPP